MNGLSRWSRRGQLYVWAVIVLVAVVLAATRLRVENPRGLWAIRPQPAASQLWAFARSQFGDREVLLVAVRLQVDPTLRVDTVTAALERWIRDQPEVGNVFGPQNVRRLRAGLGFLQSRQRQRQWRELRSVVHSADSSVAVIFVTIVPPSEEGSLEVKSAFISRLRQQSVHLVPKNAELLLAGQPVLDVALDRLLHADMRAAVPLALACISLLLAGLLGVRSMAPALAVLSSVVVLLGGLAVTGVAVSSATAIALPLTVVVGLSYGVHMALAIDRTGSARTAVREIGPPLAWSYVTTAVAVASLTLSPIRALRLFAVVSTAGLTIAFVAAITLVPLLHASSGSRWSVRGRALVNRTGFRFFAFAARRPKRTLIAWAAVGGIAALGLARVTVEPNTYLSFFPDASPVVQAHRVLDQKLNGSVPLELLVETDSGVAARQTRVRQRISEFAAAATEHHVLGPFFAPLGTGWLQRSASARAWFEGRDPRYTRAVFSMPIVPTSEARRLVGSLDSIAAAHSDDAVDLRVTGQLPASIPMQQALVDSQLRSLALLLAVVTLFLVVAARSVRVGFVLLIPNLIALATVAGTMGYMGIAVDFTTVSVCSLVLGVAVDDTLQMTWALRGPAAMGTTHGAPVAVRKTASPIAIASLAMIAGCGALLLSPFPPTQRLGGLLAVGLVVALGADLTLTPLLLSGVPSRRKSRRLRGLLTASLTRD